MLAMRSSLKKGASLHAASDFEEVERDDENCCIFVGDSAACWEISPRGSRLLRAEYEDATANCRHAMVTMQTASRQTKQNTPLDSLLFDCIVRSIPKNAVSANQTQQSRPSLEARRSTEQESAACALRVGRAWVAPPARDRTRCFFFGSNNMTWSPMTPPYRLPFLGTKLDKLKYAD